MRRIVHVLAVLGAAALSGCGGGGSVLNFSDSASIDHTFITTSAPSNIARVLPGSSIALSATAVRGSQNGYVNANRFVWSAELVPSGSYIANTDGTTKPCAAVTFTPTGTTTATPMTVDYSVYLTIDPTNESNVIFTPPAIVPPTAGGTTTVNYPYCVVVSATPRGGSAANAGSITVAVVNPANPLQ